jgi:hypothetical protein
MSGVQSASSLISASLFPLPPQQQVAGESFVTVGAGSWMILPLQHDDQTPARCGGN